MIVVAGEALIDLLVQPDGRLTAVPGGGPFNTARTIGRLGGEVAFLGRPVDRPVRRASCATRWPKRRRRPLADRGDRRADDAGDRRARRRTARRPTGSTRRTRPRRGCRPRPCGPPSRGARDAVHVGTLGLVLEPMADALAAAIAGGRRRRRWSCSIRTAGRGVITRPGGLSRPARADRRPAPTSSRSASTTSPTSPRTAAPVAAAQALLDRGPARRARDRRPGAGHRRDRDRRRSRSPVPAVAVVDTVGAGDAFGGAFLARWMERGLGRADLADSDGGPRRGRLRRSRSRSGPASAPGADPPRRADAGPRAGLTGLARLSAMTHADPPPRPDRLRPARCSRPWRPGAAAASTAAFPTQSLGNRGADVRAVQGLLRAHGIPIAIDGIFGAATREAVKAFQAANGLTANGIVGDDDLGEADRRAHSGRDRRGGQGRPARAQREAPGRSDGRWRLRDRDAERGHRLPEAHGDDAARERRRR